MARGLSLKTAKTLPWRGAKFLGEPCWHQVRNEAASERGRARQQGCPVVLVLSPTRELAIQTCTEMEVLTKGTPGPRSLELAPGFFLGARKPVW